MTTFCLYLVVCVGMVPVQDPNDACDSRTGYLIFLQESNSNFLAMWHIPCRHIRRQMLLRVVAHFFSVSYLKSLQLPILAITHILNLLLLYLGVCLRAVCRIKGNKQIVCSYCKLRNSSYIYFSSSLRASYIPQDLPRTHSAKYKCPYIL